MFNTPSCPNCGSRFLVKTMRTSGYPRSADTGAEKRFYRCFRCFEKFSPDESAIRSEASPSR